MGTPVCLLQNQAAIWHLWGRSVHVPLARTDSRTCPQGKELRKVRHGSKQSIRELEQQQALGSGKGHLKAGLM